MNRPIPLPQRRVTLLVAVLALLLVAALPVVAKKDSGTIDGPSAQGDCTAQCQDGSTVTCSGSTCNAVDYSCTAEERGYCDGSSSGTVYCPELDIDQCPVTCSVSNTCPDGTYLYCEGHTGAFACRGGGDTCYVMCDGTSGTYLWCPGHFGQRYCG